MKDNRFPFRLMEADAKKILDMISFICRWKETLATAWGKGLLLNGYVEVIEDVYLEGRRDCNASQNAILDEIFGKDEPTYKIGELIFIKSLGIWTLKYFAGKVHNGEVACYVDQKKEGSILFWKNHKPAPGITLPE